MKEKITKFNLEDAFKALDEIDVPKVKGLRPSHIDLNESCCKHTDRFEALFEDYYDIQDQNDLEDAKDEREAEVAQAKLARIEKIVDLDAESPEDIQPSYVGKTIIQCPQCMTLFYKNQEDVEKSEEDETIVNVGEICQHCGNDSGYMIIGKVAAEEIPAEEVPEDIDAEAEDMEEVPVDEEPVEEEPVEEENADEEIDLDEIPDEEVEEEKNESLNLSKFEKECAKKSDLKTEIESEHKSLNEGVEEEVELSEYEISDGVNKKSATAINDAEALPEIIDFINKSEHKDDIILDWYWVREDGTYSDPVVVIYNEDKPVVSWNWDEARAEIMNALHGTIYDTPENNRYLDEEAKDCCPECGKCPCECKKEVNESAKSDIEAFINSLDEGCKDCKEDLASEEKIDDYIEDLPESCEGKECKEEVCPKCGKEICECNKQVKEDVSDAEFEAMLNDPVYNESLEEEKSDKYIIKTNGAWDDFDTIRYISNAAVADEDEEVDEDDCWVTDLKQAHEFNSYQDAYDYVKKYCADPEEDDIFNYGQIEILQASNLDALLKFNDCLEEEKCCEDDCTIHKAITHPEEDMKELKEEDEEVAEDEVSEEEIEEVKEELPVEEVVEKIEEVAEEIKEVVEADEEIEEAIDEVVEEKVEEICPECEEDEEEIEDEENFDEVEEIVDESINKCITDYLTEVYSNVKNFELTGCEIENKKLVIEGKINFKSGKSKSTKFDFVKDGHKFHGSNSGLVENNNVYTLKYTIKDRAMIVEKLNYKYNINGVLVENLNRK